MEIYRLKIAHQFDVKATLCKDALLSYDQAESAIMALNYKYEIYIKETVKSANMIWRFSILFFWCAYLLVIITMCFKWLFTGRFYFEHDKTFVVKTMQAWGHKLGLNI